MLDSWTDYDWSDLPPQPVEDDPNTLARIAYSGKFAAAMAQFRAVVAAGEHSERALALTKAVIEQNPGHYSVWDYRFEIVKSVGNDVFDYRRCGLVKAVDTPPPVGEDGDWLNNFTLETPKNYQIWNYRQHLEIPGLREWYRAEFLVVQLVLEDDAKNFHAWSHAKWAISRCPEAFNQAELLEQARKGIDADVWNNSFWSFRYFLYHYYTPATEDVDREIEYVSTQLVRAPENEAAWDYLRGFTRTHAPEKASAVLEAEAARYPNSVRALEMLSYVKPSPELFEQLAIAEPVRAGLWRQRAQMSTE